MSTRITELAAIIKAETDRLQSLLEQVGVPSPTFSVGAAKELPREPEIQSTQASILEACTELQDLVEGPLGHLVRIVSPRINILVALQAICQFEIAKSVGKDEVVSYKDIAKRCGMHVEDAQRLIRMAISYHIFAEPRPNSVCHTAESLLLVEDALLSGWINLISNDVWPSTPHIVPAMRKWAGSQEPNETAHAEINGGDSLWDALAKDPVKAARFAQGMKFLQVNPSYDATHLCTALEWDHDCSISMVDVGGSIGHISQTLLEKHPNLRSTVQDLPEVISQTAVPDQFKGRLEYVEHNFFTEQKVRADVYLLRSILHDWSDKYAIDIIRKLIPALDVGAKVVINEVCLQEPNAMSFYDSQLVYGYDLAMKQQFNAKERSIDDWKSLFEQADMRFKLNRIVNPPGSILAVIEFVWQ